MDEMLGVEPRKVPQQRRSQAIVEALIEATARILATGDDDALNTNRIAALAGVSVGSLYQYFPNKSALIVAVARRHFARMEALLDAHLTVDPGRSMSAMVADFLHAVLQHQRAAPGLQPALTRQVLGLGLTVIEAQHARILQRVTAWLEGHREHLGDRPLAPMAFLMVNTVEGAIHTAHLCQPGFLDDPAFEADLAAMLAGILRPR